MLNRKVVTPFGMLFQVLAPRSNGNATPTYDAQTHISYIQCSEGMRLACVELASMGTDTVTRIWRETTDTDPEDDHQGPTFRAGSLLGTDTFTEAEKEATDRD